MTVQPKADGRRPRLAARRDDGRPTAALAGGGSIAFLLRHPGHRARSRAGAGSRRAAPASRPTRQPGRGAAVEYHRADDGTWAGGGRLPPALPGSAGLVRPARARRGRGRRLAGRADRGPRRRRRPAARRGRRAAARRGQGAAGRRSGARPPPRRRLCGVADPGRPCRARPRGREPPGDPAPRRRGVPALGRRSRRARSGSSRMPTSGPASGSSRWTPGSRRGGGATPRRQPTDGMPAATTTPGDPSGPAPSGSRPTSAGPPASHRGRSADWPGPATRCARHVGSADRTAAVTAARAATGATRRAPG